MTPTRTATPLPVGFTLTLDEDTRYDARSDESAADVWGGWPRRLLRLTPDGATRLRRLAGGVAVRDRRDGLLARRLVEAGLARPGPPADGGDLPGTLAVVVPVRDRPGDLDECLRSLGGSVPVTVVDDASCDGAAVAAVAARHDADLLRLSSNVGPGGARNAGLAATGAPVVAFVDSDSRVTLAELRCLARHLADPCVAVAAPRVRPLSGGRSTLARYADARSPLDLGPRAATVRPDGRVTYVPATALVARRAAVEQLGGFAPGLRYGEDVDLVWRLTDAGWAVRYDPGVVVRHREPATWPAWLARRFRYGSSAGPLAARHGDRVAGPALAGLVAPLTLSRRTRGRSLPPGAHRQAATVPLATVVGLLRWGLPLWWPICVAAARRPTTRRALAAAVAVPLAVDWWQRRPPLDPARAASAAVADEVAYGAGVWAGCVRAGTIGPLLPRVSGSRRSS